MGLMTPFFPEGGSRGARASVGSPRRLALAPGVLRLMLGLLVCLPGGLLILLGLALLAPGVLLANSGFTRLTDHFLLRVKPARPSQQRFDSDRDAPMAWTAPSSRMLQ